MPRNFFHSGLLRAVVVAAFAMLATTAQSAFRSGIFDPPDLSGTHTFELVGSDCFGPGLHTVNVQSDGNNCDVTLTKLTVLLKNPLADPTELALNFSDLLPFLGIDHILVSDNELLGVNSQLIGPVNVGEASPYTGSWSIQYAFDLLVDPVYLYDDCDDSDGSSCTPADTAFLVTFFPSDEFGNPIDADGNRIPEPGSLLLIVAALGAGWLARRRAVA